MVVKVVSTAALLILLSTGAAAWLYSRADVISEELKSAADLIPQLKTAIAADDIKRATSAADELRAHTATAKSAANDPLWVLASAIPEFGENFGAVSEVARSADDVAVLGVAPLVEVFKSLDWKKLVPGNSDVDLAGIHVAAPRIASAAHAVRESASRLEAISVENLLPQVSEPLVKAREELAGISVPLSAAANTSSIAPAMLGGEGARNYLLMVQNNAETRASGGIPGALAVLTFDNGKMTLGAQSSATILGPMAPVLPVEEEQKRIYTARLGKYMQDVNLTPDFPTTAATAQAMWEEKTGQRVDGVISIDPLVLSYILQTTGPVAIGGSELAAVEASGLPTELTGSNVVPTLLSDVYAKIHQPKLQDAYFAAVAQEVFAALSHGRGESQGLIAGLTRGVEEGRVLLWSTRVDEQSVIGKYTLSGSIAGPSVSPAEFGVYFNDGTGAKMDYYVKRTVKLIKECPRDGYEQTTVRITSTNTAPGDAATSLSEYVTGGGFYGVPPGSVQTNIVAYGPVQANVESARADGKQTEFAPYVHSERPVGVLAQRLAPGETKTVEFTFGKIVQHSEPNLVVTPTVQSVKDVTLPSEKAVCD
ncbi:DUF4012 domain-containing protein [Pseudarthrobacter sp. fls2-241-R2A-168]|uniref:DUF4012 domain-containing protein n=1 Tax=Pseudarthrobacter sp. fls2-241-R2A-168 TaxID=3040304 RepID=UPI0025551FF3|nr:DUF4012 domain-containing protein [Pseudarthrobacter sp. fls2-241-R2A-168]